MKITKLLTILCINILTAALFMSSSSADNDERVRAKVGIQVKSSDKAFSARSREVVKTGDFLRIYVHPETGSFLYVVHTDGKTVDMLNMTEQKLQQSTVVLPSVQTFYKIDGNSTSERFTVICSPEALSDVASLATKEIPYKKWQGIENELIKKSRIELTAVEETPFSIGGNVRGTLDDKETDPFVGNMQIFSGKGLLVKQYEFQVKK